MVLISAAAVTAFLELPKSFKPTCLQDCPLVSVVKVTLPLLAVTCVRDRRITAKNTFPSVGEVAQLDFECPSGDGEGCRAVVAEQAGRTTIHSHDHHLTGPITWKETHQALQSLFLSSFFLCLSPPGSWNLGQHSTRPDRFPKETEVLCPALGTCQISHLYF